MVYSGLCRLTPALGVGEPEITRAGSIIWEKRCVRNAELVSSIFIRSTRHFFYFHCFQQAIVRCRQNEA